jgi:hypothetical protein
MSKTNCAWCGNLFNSKINTASLSSLMYKKNDYRFFCSQKCRAEAKNNGINVVGGDKCFIATSVYGNYNHPIVIEFRSFRDNWLEKQIWGSNFIDFYYKYGALIAKIIDKSAILKILALILILKPLQIIIRIFKLNKIVN